MAQHQAAWKMCFRSRDRGEEETGDKTALTLTPKGGGLGELLPCRNSSVSTRILCAGGALPVLIQGIRERLHLCCTVSTNLPGAVTSTNTHGFNWGCFFFNFHCSHMFRAVTFLSSVCIWMAAFSLSCLSHASLRQPAPRAAASTNDSVLSGARSAKHLQPSLPFPSCCSHSCPGQVSSALSTWAWSSTKQSRSLTLLQQT